MTNCQLCDLPVTDGQTDESVEGTFCCRGCLEVYRTLGDVDETEDHTREPPETPDDAETAYFGIDGMHCSSCEAYLESAARDRAGVYTAQASYAAEAIKVSYDPEVLCEDDLVETLSGMGYRARGRDAAGDNAEATPTDVENQLIVGGVLGMMVMLSYVVFLYPTYFGYEPLADLGTYDGAHVYGQLAALTAVILLYTGGPMLRSAYVGVRAGRPNVDLLVTIAALAAYFYSTGSLLVGRTDLYYDVTVVVILAVTAGNYYKNRIKAETAGLLADLTALRTETATDRDGNEVPVEAIEPGDQLLVKPGERIPVDGTVREGSAAVDEALVTGESLPETKRPGDPVLGGTVVTDAPLVVEATGTESTLDRIVELLWDVQASRPSVQRVADKLATAFVPLVLVVAAAASTWLLVSGTPLRVALLTGLTVLIVSCPCALGLATPLAIAASLQSAATRGVVVTTPALFEHGGDVDTLVLDKTGTLTDGEMAVRDVFSAGKASEETLLSRAAAVEQYSTHPIAQAITDAATGVRADGGTARRALDARGEGPDPVGDDAGGAADTRVASFERLPRGVSATVGDDRILVGHPDLLRERGYVVPAAIESRLTAVDDRRAVPVVVGWDGRARGLLAVGDEKRDHWEQVATRVDGRTVVLTGDDGPAADRLREHPAIDRVYAGVPPDGKTATVRRLAAAGTVAMVGDGSNDAPALAAADIGIALEDGTELATDAADAVVLDGDLRRLPVVFDTASTTARRIRENLTWAFVYNGIAIPLAITGVLNPLFAALAMATSSLLVVANSARTIR